MATTEELVEGICSLIENCSIPIPIVLMNHDAMIAHEIISKVVDRCSSRNVVLKDVCVDPELAQLLALKEADLINSRTTTVIHCQDGLGRQVLFRRN